MFLVFWLSELPGSTSKTSNHSENRVHTISRHVGQEQVLLLSQGTVS